ncbi:MAG: hypothetical protein RLZZ271_522 [Pseudomonadota bacterium]|jgi:sirohydrochlorin cobaltochelatase
MTLAAPATRAIILFAHGSRDPNWSNPVRAVAAQVALQSPQTPVACAYLELMSPNLAESVASLVAAHPQLETISIYPVFLGMGRHAREDLPLLMQELQALYPGVRFVQMPSAGESQAVLDAIAQSALAALA